MKEFQGTPGPWSINHYYNWIESENADRVVIGGSQGFDADDANLIAAAPELLEALQETIHEVGHWLSTQKPELKEKIESAINKALGE